MWSSSGVWIDPEAEPFCPFIRYTRRWGPILVNPALDNRTRLKMLGEALYGEVWHRRVARDLGVSTSTMGRWVGTGEPDRNYQPPEQVINRLLAVLRDRADHLLFVVEECRLPPWID
jgi:transposase-like protein